MEMERGGLERISIPFVTGVALGSLMIGIGTSPVISAVISIYVLPALIILHIRDKLPLGSIPIFLVLGLFCISNSHLPAPIGSPWAQWTHAEKAADALKSGIAAIPFSYTECNSLLTALLTGDRSGLESSTINNFRAAGASHILALSGLHIGIIYLVLSRFLSIMGWSPVFSRIRSIILISASGFYTMMTGASPSLVRAFLFILVSETGKMLPGRKTSPERTLQTALVIQLAIVPDVIGELGFQLSYLAVCGIIYLRPVLSSWYPEHEISQSEAEAGQRETVLHKFNPMRKIWDLTALSISCQCFTAPLVWFRFHSFPKFFLLTNLLVMPLTSAGICSGLVCSLLQLTGRCPAALYHICEDCLSLMLKALEIIASM